MLCIQLQAYTYDFRLICYTYDYRLSRDAARQLGSSAVYSRRRVGQTRRYSVYLLYRYKSTNPDAASRVAEWGEDLKVEDSYTGPHLTWPVTLEQVEAVLHHIRSRPHEPLHQKYVSACGYEALERVLVLLLCTCVCSMCVSSVCVLWRHAAVYVSSCLMQVCDATGRAQPYVLVKQVN
jgi:hypothetical protein